MANNVFKKIICTKPELQKIVLSLQKKLNDYYSDKLENKPLVCIGLLKGCIPFMSDLLRNLNFECEMNYLGIDSYLGHSKKMTKPIIVADLILSSLKNRDILIIDDIVESGESLEVIKEYLMKFNPKSIKSIVCLTKEGCEEQASKVDWVGFKVQKEFLVGYGLDYKNIYRNHQVIAAFDKEKYNMIYSKKSKNKNKESN